jgi:hypothetical protein
MTFFNGNIWVAWRGGWYNDNGAINVASVAPCQLGGNCVVGSFSISVTPDSQTVPYTGQWAYYTVTVTPTGGFNGTVQLSVDWVGDNEPNGLTVGIYPNSVTGSGTATVWADAIMPGYYTIIVTGESGNLGDVEYAQLIVQ